MQIIIKINHNNTRKDILFHNINVFRMGGK